MVALAMPKKRSEAVTEGGGEKDGRKSTAVQVEKDLARMVGMICQHRRITQSELLSPVIREFVEAEYAATIRQIQQEAAKKKSGREIPER